MASSGGRIRLVFEKNLKDSDLSFINTDFFEKNLVIFSSSSYSTLTNSTRAETSNNRQSTNMERRLMRSPHVLSNCIPSVKEEEIDELKSLMEKRLYDNPSMLREIRRLLTVSKMREAPLSSYNSWRGGQELLRQGWKLPCL